MKNRILQRLKTAAKKGMLFYYKMLLKRFHVKKNWIVFQSSLGREYGGNPRAVYEEMVRQGLDRIYRCYYILDDTKGAGVPGRAKTVRNSRFRYYYIMAVSGIWISDTRFQNYIIKRKETLYIQTWHGTPIKKLALDMQNLTMAEGTDLLAYQEEFRKNTATWDYLVVQNSYSLNIFRNAFAFKGIFLTTGYPRNDILFRSEIRPSNRELRQKYGIPEHRKVMLYAPTWRDDAFYGAGSYKFETELDFKAMQKAFQQEYVLLVKQHYTANILRTFHEYGDFIIPAYKNSDISELYLIADLLITDYSSVMFDYSILKKPIFFYVYDYAKYRDELRGLYFDLHREAPGPVVDSTEELIRSVGNYQKEAYKKTYMEFSSRYHEYEKGTAAKQIVEVILQKT